MPISRAESLSLRYPFRIPFSIRTVSCVGAPSSSTFKDPRRHGIVPLSITVQPSLATRLPISPANAEVFLRLKSASRPSPTENHFHFAGGSFACVELKDCLPGRFFGEEFGILVSEEEVEGDASAAAGAATGRIVFGLSDTRYVHAGQGLGIFGEGSVRGYDENISEFVGIAGADFLDARIVGTRCLVRPHHEFDLRGDFGVDRRQSDRI